MKTVWEGYGEASLPERKCPNCGARARTQLVHCPECDRRYDRRLPWLTDPLRWALGAFAVAAFVVACILILPGVFESRDDRLARLAAEQRQLEADERARLTREQRPIRGRGGAEPRHGAERARLAARATLVVDVEAAILADVRGRISTGELKGDAVRAECGPLIRTPGRAPDDQNLRVRIGRYDCVAVQSDVVNRGKTVGKFGHPYIAAIDFRRGTYTFCKDNKAPGERGKPLATVPLAPECLGLPKDATRIGRGYSSGE